MGNQIALEFAHLPRAEAAAAIARHIENFWEPRMRRTIEALVAAGEGIALLPRIMLRAAHPAVAIRPLAADPPMRRIAALRLATRYLTPATGRFLALLAEASADYVGVPGGAAPFQAGRPTR